MALANSVTLKLIFEKKGLFKNLKRNFHLFALRRLTVVSPHSDDAQEQARRCLLRVVLLCLLGADTARCLYLVEDFASGEK